MLTRSNTYTFTITDDIHLTATYIEASSDRDFWETEYFAIIALSNSTTIYAKTTYSSDIHSFDIEYSLDKVTWTPVSIYSSATSGSENVVTLTTLNNNDILYIRGTNTTMSYNSDTTYSSDVRSFCRLRFDSNNKDFKVAGNIMSLLYRDNFQLHSDALQSNERFGDLFGSTRVADAGMLVLPANTLSTNCYEGMFRSCQRLTVPPLLTSINLAQGCYYGMFLNCSSLTSAPTLPATTLASRCYSYMFDNCTSLTSAPALPATTLAPYCYDSMFHYCLSLVNAPALPATTLSEGCYGSMFNNCRLLTPAPTLPATTLASKCYQYMFAECYALTSPPELPATTLALRCYYSMFYGCNYLTSSPVLPATTLVEACYSYMFQGCTRISTVIALFTTNIDINPTLYTQGWMYNVRSSGHFLVSPDATWTLRGSNGVPTNWTIYTYAGE